MKRIILDLCGGTGSWSKPFKDAGYEVHVITLPDYDVEKWYQSNHNGVKCITFTCITAKDYSQDIIVPIKDIYGVFSAPPCTMFSRARTTAKTPRDFVNATKPVRATLDIIWTIEFNTKMSLKFWAIENPAGHLRRFLGNPAFKFQPYEFGDRHSKETFIWGRFVEPKKKPVQLNEQEIIQSRNNTRPLPQIPTDYKRDEKMKSVQIRRSITPKGFAEAFYKANKDL